VSNALCVRCGQPIRSIGAIDFHHGTRFGMLGDIGEGFVSKLETEAFRCDACGHLEFFDKEILRDNYLTATGALPATESSVQILPGGEDLPPEEPY
jgi:hypothetical protein